MKVLVFDMDGTIADLYGVDKWLDMLRNFDSTPYKTAKPLYDMDTLQVLLNLLKKRDYKIVVTSWLSKESNNIFDKQVRQAKKDWLDFYGFPYDELHIVKYGTTKAECTRGYGKEQILFDDNAKVRSGWTLGKTVDASTENILKVLADLLLAD